MNRVVAPSYPASLKLFIDALDGSYSGSGTTVVDKIGTQNGVMVNGVTWNATDGFIFDGTNDLITFAHNSAIKPTTRGSISVMCRFTTSPNAGIVVSTMETNTYRKGVTIFQDGSPARSYVASNTVGQSITYGSRFINTWKMLTVTWDGTSIKNYINDSLYSTVAQTVLVTSNTSPVTIGDLSPTDYPFQGNVSWLKIYDDVITLSDVQDNFNSIKTRHGL